MPSALPAIKRDLVLALFAQGMTVKQVQEETKMARTTIFNIKANMKVFSQPTRPKLAQRGRPRELTAEMSKVRVISMNKAMFVDIYFTSGPRRLSD